MEQKKEFKVPGLKLIDPTGNQVEIIKGPIPFKDVDEDIDDPEAGFEDAYKDDDDFYQVKVIKVIHGPSNLGEARWWSNDELFTFIY